ncbi:MAG: FAD-dependent oxidoreductase, partial [Acidimicrobiales bacterium]
MTRPATSGSQPAPVSSTGDGGRRQPVVAVVGGGITGLAAALALAGAGEAPRVVLLEAGERLGGKICTEDQDGLPVEAGPDAFLARVPHAVDLCQELGLAG